MHLVSYFWRWVIFCFVEKDSCLMVVFFLVFLQYCKYIWLEEQEEECQDPRLGSWSSVSNKWWSMKKWRSSEVIWICHGVINSWKCSEGDHEGVWRRRKWNGLYLEYLNPNGRIQESVIKIYVKCSKLNIFPKSEYKYIWRTLSHSQHQGEDKIQEKKIFT